MSVIEAHALTKKYSKFTAVDAIELAVEEGQIYGFLGPNGAGKTTTLRMLAGIIRPTSGSISIGGIDLAKNPIEAKRITSFIPDRPYLYEKLTAAEFLEFIGGLYQLGAADCARRAEALLDRFELLRFAGSLIETFSHGMKQRLVFSAALLPQPRVLIVDEPMVGLDPKGVRLVKDIFREQRQSCGTTVLLSTHTMHVAEELCDRISVIHGGRIVSSGTLKDLHEATGDTRANLEEIFLSLTRESESDAAGAATEAP